MTNTRGSRPTPHLGRQLPEERQLLRIVLHPAASRAQPARRAVDAVQERMQQLCGDGGISGEFRSVGTAVERWRPAPWTQPSLTSCSQPSALPAIRRPSPPASSGNICRNSAARRSGHGASAARSRVASTRTPPTSQCAPSVSMSARCFASSASRRLNVWSVTGSPVLRPRAAPLACPAADAAEAASASEPAAAAPEAMWTASDGSAGSGAAAPIGVSGLEPELPFAAPSEPASAARSALLRAADALCSWNAALSASTSRDLRRKSRTRVGDARACFQHPSSTRHNPHLLKLAMSQNGWYVALCRSAQPNASSRDSFTFSTCLGVRVQRVGA